MLNIRCVTCDLKQPTYNHPNEENALYCNDCKNCGMIDIKHKKCIICDLRANFNYKDEEKALYCIDCKKCGMANLIDKNA